MGWVVLKTKSRHEHIAKSYVDLYEDDDVETFLPKILEQKIPSPLFPNYLFVKIFRQWRFLLSMKGVLGIIRSGGSDNPAVIDQRVIDAIKLKIGKDGYIVLPKKPRFEKGQHVKITSGLFEDRVGIYAGASCLERETVLLNIMGRQTPISVGASSIVATA